jgi:putative transposase
MPRAHRHFLPGYVWHVTHRCHKREFLLKFARDRRRWRHWLFEARKRFGLCVLNYIVTSNHVHLLVHDQGKGEIARSMQLIAGRTGQEYNRRKGRQGAYWEDRYHATAVDSEAYLARCLVYIDMNMVRAGVVAHPQDWADSGYRELMVPPKRYRVVDVRALLALLELRTIAELQEARAQWIAAELAAGASRREAAWSESLAVGSEGFVADIQRQLGARARYREVIDSGEIHCLREPPASYDVGFEP